MPFFSVAELDEQYHASLQYGYGWSVVQDLAVWRFFGLITDVLELSRLRFGSVPHKLGVFLCV
jgi:hypothetical protein